MPDNPRDITLKASRKAKERWDIPDRTYDKIRRILKARAGLRIDDYKDSCVKRRISVRMRTVGCETWDEYVQFLLAEQSEIAILAKRLTIHVSKFFRNPSTYEKLRDEVLPALFSRRRDEGCYSLTFRSIGCAAGEEPYTLAMMLSDSFAEELTRFGVTILACDIDRDILEHAANAVYGPESLEETPPGAKKRHFSLRDGRYHLNPGIRDMVRFDHENLVRPLPPAGTDLILCRNVLIYFDRSAQEAIIASFAEALRPGGYLVLGKTETLMGRQRSLFQAVCPVERIYRKP